MLVKMEFGWYGIGRNNVELYVELDGDGEDDIMKMRKK